MLKRIVSRIRSHYVMPVARKTALFCFAFAIGICAYAFFGLTAAIICCAAGLIAFALGFARGTDPGKRLRVAALGIALGCICVFAHDALFISSVNRVKGYEGEVSVSVVKRKNVTQYGGAYYILDVITASGERCTVEAHLKDESIKPGTQLKTEMYIYYTPEYRTLSAKILSDITYTKRVIYPKHIPAIISSAVADSIERVMPGDISAFIKSITVADREEFMDMREYEAMRAAGAAHIVAVSGMHVSFLTALIGTVFRRKRPAAIIGIATMAVFTAVVGFTPSVMRAALMQSLVLIAPLVQKRSDGVTSVSFALFIILLLNPFAVLGIGLWLSFLATIGITIVSKRVSFKLKSRAQKTFFYRFRISGAITGFVIESLSMSVGALIFTSPIIAYSFGTVSLVAPLTNLLVLWAVSIAFCAGLIAAVIGLFWIPGAHIIGYAAVLPARYIIWMCGKLARLPFSTVYTSNKLIVAWLITLYISILAFAAGKTKLIDTLALLLGAGATLALAIILPHSAYGAMRVTAVNVGQGQCIVITYAGETVVFDCGSSNLDAGAAIDAYFQKSGVSSVTLLCLTHFDYDHTSGIDTVFDRYGAPALLIPEPRDDDYSAENVISTAVAYGAEIIYVSDRYEFAIGEAKVSIFRSNGGSANDGLIFLVSLGEWDVLIMGDADSIAEQVYIESCSPPDIELLIAGHHGSAYSTSNELLEYTKPEAAIISVGKNSYGHPSAAALQRLQSHGIEILRTDRLGNIEIYAG